MSLAQTTITTHVRPQEEVYWKEDWIYQPGKHTLIIGRSGSGKTQLLFNILANCVRKGYTTIYISDERREVYSFLKLPEFRDKILIHSPRKIEIDPENVVLSGEDKKYANVVLHPPLGEERIKGIFKRLKKKGINIIDDLAQLRYTYEKVGFIKDMIDYAVFHGIGGFKLFMDEFEYIAPRHISGTQYKGHMTDAAVIASAMNRLRSLNISLIASTQTILKVNVDGVRNMNNIVMLKCDPKTADEVWTSSLMPEIKVDLVYLMGKIPDPLYQIFHSNSDKPPKAMGIAYNTDRNLFTLKFEAPPSLFMRRYEGRVIWGTNPVPVRVGGEIEADANTTLKILLYVACQKLKERGVSTLSIYNAAVRQGGIGVSRDAVYKWIRDAEKIIQDNRLLVKEAEEIEEMVQSGELVEAPEEEKPSEEKEVSGVEEYLETAEEVEGEVEGDVEEGEEGEHDEIY